MSRKAVLKSMFEDKEDKYAFECDLISKVEPLRFLWDTKQPDYKNKMKRQNAFVRIGTELGKSGMLDKFIIFS